MSLAQLPTELWILICTDSDLEVEDRRNLSLVCWRFRHICSPSILHSVAFSCTKRGLEDLQKLAQSECRQYVEYLSYYMPPFLEQAVEQAEQTTVSAPIPDEEHNDAEAALLAEAKQIIHQRSEENQYIMANGMDLAALSLALRSLPSLNYLHLTFRKYPPGGRDAISRKLDDFVAQKETLEYHLPILAQAVSQARAAGRRFSSIELLGVWLSQRQGPQVLGADEPSRAKLRDCAKQILEGVDCAMLSLCGDIISLCESTPLGLREMHILNTVVDYEALRTFLKHNISTLKRIKYYFVQLQNQPEDEDRWLKAGFFSKILHSFHSTAPSRKRVWRQRREDTHWTFTRVDLGLNNVTI
ncbi:hypothetical protein BJY00DRAFT_251133 [Aspergillus carlsbadensis]|nr:hypothetical protein BJY00DRAFT_251133 [Aspergillus carlsbadensis]